MPSEPERRAELAAFLRAKRERLPRSSLGLPPARGARLDGVSREEVAVNAAMSATWYTWLEQARPMNPSRQVLDALARVLALTTVEHAYVLGLLGYAAQAAEPELVDAAPAHLQRLLDAMGTFPAFALAPDWQIVGWNHGYQRLYPSIAEVPPGQRNLLWLVFTDPHLRQLLPDWPTDSRHFVAEFRAEAGPRLTDPAYEAQIHALQEASHAFAEVWRDHEVQRFASRERRFRHPEVGDLVFEHHRLFPSDGGGLHLVAYTAAPGTGTEERLARLLGPPTTTPPPPPPPPAA